MLSPEIDKNCQNDFKKHYVHLEYLFKTPLSIRRPISAMLQVVILLCCVSAILYSDLSLCVLQEIPVPITG